MRKSLDLAQSEAKGESKSESKRAWWQKLDWRQRVAIDLGSQEVRIFRGARPAGKSSEASETLLIEQACVAIKQSGEPGRAKQGAGKQGGAKVLAIGQDAWEMRGRLGKEVDLIFPLVAGRIVDQELAKLLLKELLKRALKVDSFLPFVWSPIVMVTVRASTSDFARRQLVKLFYDLGASEVYLLAEPLAAAIGVGVPIADPSGTLLMQLGASTIEAAAISLGTIVNHQSNLWTGALAGWAVDDLLRAFLLKEHHLMISQEASEQLKKQLSLDDSADFKLSLSGKDLVSQQARTLELNNLDFAPILTGLAQAYLQMIEELLKQIPTALLSDILDKGLLLSGNFAKITALDQYLAKHLKMPVALVDDPDLAAATGAVTVLENLDQFKESLAYA